MASQTIAENPNGSASVGLTQRMLALLRFLTINAWFAYGTLFLLQFKIIYGMWFYRDMPSGDTSYYFVDAASWYHNFSTSIAWSPIYTAFYGTLLNISHDVFLVTLMHRLIITFIVSMLVLALMRRLLPHSIAWLIAGWWVILPVNFDVLFEVHLFAVIPTLIAFLVALYKPTLWTRGAVLGIFLAAAFLVRNELFVTTGIWLIICITWEVYRARENGRLSRLRYALAYGIPVILTVVLVLGFYWRSTDKFPVLSTDLEEKHTLNVCQIYAYNYEQRHTDWKGDPWTQCQSLMTQVFGVPQPSMLEAFERNPKAMLAYFGWNVRLIPDGIQILLFDATAGNGQPDYITRITNSRRALILSLLTLLILAVGLWRLRRDHWWDRWIKERAWGWLALLCTVVVTFIVMVAERPRPSYLFNLFFFFTAVIGMCLYAIIDRWIKIQRFALIMPVLAIILIIAVPPFFDKNYQNPRGNVGQPVYMQYERLAPFQNLISQPGSYLLGDTSWIVCLYVGLGQCQPLEYQSFIRSKPATISVGDWLQQKHVTLFYVDENVFADPVMQSFLANPRVQGWDVVTVTQAADSHWELLARQAS